MSANIGQTPNEPAAVPRELIAHEVYLANYLVPILANMIETLLSRYGYSGDFFPEAYQTNRLQTHPKRLAGK